MNKKLIGWGIILVIAVVAYFFYEELGVIVASFLGLLGFNISDKMRSKRTPLDQKADAIKKDLDNLRKEREKLEKDGVKDLSTDEEVKYWENE